MEACPSLGLPPPLLLPRKRTRTHHRTQSPHFMQPLAETQPEQGFVFKPPMPTIATFMQPIELKVVFDSIQHRQVELEVVLKQAGLLARSD